MVTRRPRPPAPQVDVDAAADFIAGADSQPVRREPVRAAQQVAPAPRSTNPLTTPPLLPAADDVPASEVPVDQLPKSMVIHFKGDKSAARDILELNQHYDRSKQYIAYAALVRGLQLMKDEAGLS